MTQEEKLDELRIVRIYLLHKLIEALDTKDSADIQCLEKLLIELNTKIKASYETIRTIS